MKKSHDRPARGSAKEAKAIQQRKLQNADDEFYPESEVEYGIRMIRRRKYYARIRV